MGGIERPGESRIPSSGYASLHCQRHTFPGRGRGVPQQGHADRIAERIVQLDGDPDLNPEGLASRSHSQYVEGDTLVEMIREDLIAERIAIESYSEIIRYLGDNDSTSRRLMEDILANEEEHAEEMKTLLESIGEDEKKDEKKTERKAAS